jgi:Zn-finger nucleic acid-binding protein
MEGTTKHGIASLNCPNCGAAVAPDSPSCKYCGSALALRICASCYGAVSVGMRHCPHCGAEVAASSAQKGDSLHCPRCACSLAVSAVGRHMLHICDKCGGVWVDKSSFQDICTKEEEQEAVLRFQEPEIPSAPQAHAPRRAYIPCPVCGKLMNQKNFSGCSGVVLDWCRDHGTWLDRRELQRIVVFIKNGGLRKARELEQANLREQEERLRMQEFQLAAFSRRLDADSGGFAPSQNDNSILQFISQMFR